MALRADEKFVVDAISQHYGAIAREGANPPDAYLTFQGRDILLEVTQLSEQVFVAGKPVPRRTHDEAGTRIIIDLNALLEVDMPLDKSICLVLSMPVDNPRDFKRDLARELRRLIPAPPLEEFELKIGNSTVYAQFTNRLASNKAVTGSVSNSAASPYILGNVKAMLTDRISVKEKICSAIEFKGSRWLGLYNDYFLADERIYQQAFRGLALQHSFEKILLVTDAGVVLDVIGRQ